MPSPEKGQGSSGDEGAFTTLSQLLSLNYLDPKIPLSPYAFPEESFESSGPLIFLQHNPLTQIFLQTNRLEEEVVPMTEGQMPKRKSDLETQKPPQDLLLCDIGAAPC